jgi:multicomponent Na+:H+ antiporter subunit D
MVSVAVLCVVYGLFPDALFAILPGGEYEYTTFTVGHLVEGFGLAAAGAVGFVLLKRPLSKVGRVRDVDALYNPLAFYGTRALVRGVTGTYAAVDRAAVRAAEGSMWAAGNPRDALRRVGYDPTHGDERHAPRTLDLNVGSSVLVLAAVVSVGIVVLVVL